MYGTEELLDEVKKIYSFLGDEISKDIFINRLLYNITGDLKYVDTMVRNNVKEFADSGINMKIDAIRNKVSEVSKSRKIVIYGAGQIGLELYKDIGEYIVGFCDRDIEKQKKGVGGHKVISPAELIKKKEEYINHMFLEEQQYFDEELIKFEEEEVFVDGGCLNFLTSKQLLSKCNTVKKIYAFEPDSISARRCYDEAGKSGFDNYTIIEKGLYSKETELYFNSLGNGCSSILDKGNCKVRVTSIDETIKDKVTFIKMDIEGTELEALIGAKDTITKYKPKLAISVYHKKQDIIDIPLYIKSLVSEYKLFLRHYSNHAGETVLYAIRNGE